VAEVISKHGRISGPGTEFYQLCAYEHVQRVVKRVVAMFDEGEDEDAKQLKLEGFDHLRIAYSMQRDGTRVLVPIADCTDDELLARAQEYDQQARGYIAHAEELRTFVKRRSHAARRHVRTPPKKRRSKRVL
jgi:hypothetical protein